MFINRTLLISLIVFVLGIGLWVHGVYIIPNEPIHAQDFLAGVGEAFIGVSLTILGGIVLIATVPLKIYMVRHHPQSPIMGNAPTT